MQVNALLYGSLISGAALLCIATGSTWVRVKMYTKLLNKHWRLVITTRARACSARRRVYWIKIGLGLGMTTFSRQRLECTQFRLGQIASSSASVLGDRRRIRPKHPNFIKIN